MTSYYTTLISASQLKSLIKRPNLRLFDCRFNLLDEEKGAQQFSQGHIPNSQYADLNKQLAGPLLQDTGRHPLPDKNRFETQLRLWGVDESSQIVAYDDVSGSIAARLWWLCRWAGLKYVAVLDGGLKQWIDDGNSLSVELVSFRKTDYRAKFNDRLWVSTRDIEQFRYDPAVLITDARAAKRFAGETEPIDSQAGHVPGAVNYPFEKNLGQDGCFLGPEQLLRRHREDAGKSNVIAMCGSGVTACHNMLARAHAGLDPGQLYVGSWSEWITDPARDINTGDAC